MARDAEDFMTDAFEGKVSKRRLRKPYWREAGRAI
jgi:hypothetical protein